VDYPCYIDTGDCTDYRSYAYPCYTDLGDCTDYQSSAYPCVDPPQTWYLDSDGDGWHSQITQSVNSPGSKWKSSTNGEDCDDTDSLLHKNCDFKILETKDRYLINTDKFVFDSSGELKIKVIFELVGETDTNTLTALLPYLSATMDDVGGAATSSAITLSGTKFEVTLIKPNLYLQQIKTQ
jgi:hypothetical protein